MRNFRPAELGDVDIFDVIETSPGRVDPRTGVLVESTALPEKDRKGMFDWVETSPGRVDPRTGKLVSSRAMKRGAAGSSQEKGVSRFGPSSEGEFRMPPRALSRFRGGDEGESRQEPKRAEGAFNIFERPVMNGRLRVGCDTCGGMGSSHKDDGPGIALLLFGGVAAVVALEAFGITSWSKKV